MVIHTISNGPSGRDALVDHDSVVITVNKAATLHRSDWWVVSDASCFIDHYQRVMDLHPICKPTLFTRRFVGNHIGGLFNRPDLVPIFEQWPVMMQEDLKCDGLFPYNTGTAWNQWSGLAALGLTYLLARRRRDYGDHDVRVVLSGYDLVGEADCLGPGTSVERHSRAMDDRWTRERDASRTWIWMIKDKALVVHGNDRQNNPSW